LITIEKKILTQQLIKHYDNGFSFFKDLYYYTLLYNYGTNNKQLNLTFGHNDALTCSNNFRTFITIIDTYNGFKTIQ